MALDKAEGFLTFLGKELKANPLVGTNLILLIIIGGLAYTVFWQETRYDRLNDRHIICEREKQTITNDLLREQIKSETRMEVIERKLDKQTESLEKYPTKKR